MANSRLEKIGTIYTRVHGLIQSKAMKLQDTPIWYELYEAFPPKEEPTYARPAPNIPLKKIFYEEDKIRAEFHKKSKSAGTVNLGNNETKSVTQNFIEIYKKMQELGTISSAELFENSLEALKHDRKLRQQMFEESGGLANDFKEAQHANENKKSSVDVSALLKD